MQPDASHPAVRFAVELFADDGWEVVDSLSRDDEAVVVDLRRDGERLLFLSVARDGEWVRPGLVASSGKPIPEERPAATLPLEPLQGLGTRGSGWPGPDGGPPEKVWMSVEGFAAADVVAVEVTTSLDRHQADVRADGSFLTLVRAHRRQNPDLRLRLADGDERHVDL